MLKTSLQELVTLGLELSKSWSWRCLNGQIIKKLAPMLSLWGFGYWSLRHCVCLLEKLAQRWRSSFLNNQTRTTFSHRFAGKTGRHVCSLRRSSQRQTYLTSITSHVEHLVSNVVGHVVVGHPKDVYRIDSICAYCTCSTTVHSFRWVSWKPKFCFWGMKAEPSTLVRKRYFWIARLGNIELY